MKTFADRNEYFEVFAEVSMFTLDVILKCAFSYDIDCQNFGYVSFLWYHCLGMVRTFV